MCVLIASRKPTVEMTIPLYTCISFHISHRKILPPRNEKRHPVFGPDEKRSQCLCSGWCPRSAPLIIPPYLFFLNTVV